MRKRILLFFLLTICCALVLTACSESNSTSESQNDDTPEEETIDLSAFDGTPAVSVSVNIEKEDDSHLIDVVALVTNNSNKKITKMKLYLVKCYDDDTVLESWQYADRPSISDIELGETCRSRWVLGTTTEGAREYRVFVAWILFEDGTEWGTEEIVHKAVVTRGFEADVQVYDSHTVTTEQQFLVTYSARLISNSHVGDNWSYGMKNGETSFQSGATISVSVAQKRGPKLTIYGLENDSNDDFSQEDITFSNMGIGQTETITEQIVIVENEGRYTGHKAYMEFTVTVKRIR